jgi:very-short-patch-repair endonuclease
LIEVTIARGRRAAHPGVIVHTSLTLTRSETTRLGKVPITTVKRTIEDLPRHLKEEAFDTAIRDRRLTPNAFVDAKGYLGRLAKDRLGLGIPHWKIEREALDLIRAHRLPDPSRQHWVGEFRVDLAYPDWMIAIELKGSAPHWGRARFQYDIDRSNALKLARWDEYTFTWWDVTERPDHVAATIRTALSAAR